MIGLAKVTGKEYAEAGITVNTLAPGPVKTEMSSGVGSEIIDLYIQDVVPMKRCVI